tara:strand:- start:13852 stop:16161 length:2310 start_codon:yes stop_codon:yes gene_type:complete
MPGWSQRPLFKNPHNMMGGGFVGMPKGIPGYEQGSVVEEMPAYRQEQLAKEAEYQKAVEKIARLFSSSDPNRPRLLRDYESNLHWYAKNIAGGHQVPEEQVMQDLEKAIEAQRGAPKMRTGGIVMLQTGGMAPELFEGEEIVETNPMINAMAAQGGPGIASVSAAPAPEAMPERNVPNERGIIELALDAEEVEDDEPIVAMAKQEAQGRLDEEFNILKSTAKAEEATGNSPSFIIKSSMDDLARSARRIENEITEKYPEVPADANLISSDDLMPYREELVAIFQVPEVGSEEPLMDTAVMAKKGGLIPGYQDGGEVSDEWAWIDEDIRNEGVSLETAEELMVKKYGPDIAQIKKLVEEQKGGFSLPGAERRRIEGLSYEELLEERRKETTPEEKAKQELLDAIKGTEGFRKSGFMTKVGQTGGVSSILKDPRTRAIVTQYQEMMAPPIEESPIEEIEVTAQKRGLPEGQESVDQGLSFQDTGQDLAAIMKAGKDAGMSNAEIMELIKLMQQGDPLAGVKEKAETLKGTTEKSIEGITSILDQSIKDYGEDAKKQDENMRKIFDDIERRIPEQARYRALSTPTQTVGSGATAVKKDLLRKSFEQDRFQQNNRNKIEFENLRKQETEARRDRDVKALYDIKLKQYEILSNIDKSMLDAEAALAQSQIENELAMDLERLKVELGTGGTTYGADAVMAQREKSDNFSIEENMTYATRQYGAAYASERYNELSGEKTVSSGGVSKQVNFAEFYRQSRNAGKKPKEIITDWVSRP